MSATAACRSLVKLLWMAAMAWQATASAAPTLEPGVLLIGSDLSYPPYNYLDEKKRPNGFDVEFMTAVAQASGLRVRFVDTRFEQLIPGVESQRFDLIASTLYVKPERALQIDFIPYMKTGVSIGVARGGGFHAVEPEHLCGHKVGSIKGAAWIAHLKKLSDTVCVQLGPIEVREYATSNEATQALLGGSVDAQLEDSVVLQEAVRRSAGRLVISSTRNLYPVVVGLGLNRHNKELGALLRPAVERFRQTPDYRRLLEKYNVGAPTEIEFMAALSADRERAAREAERVFQWIRVSPARDGASRR